MDLVGCDELDAVRYLARLIGRAQVEKINSSYDLIEQYYQRIKSLEAELKDAKDEIKKMTT